MDVAETNAYSYIKSQSDEVQYAKNSDSPDTVLTSSANGCFDCNICLDLAVDPVVSLCGHLYCWPCIYKWLTTSEQCPVCKSRLSETTLVPLYGRGRLRGNGEPDIPRRPPLLTRREGQIHDNYSRMSGLHNGSGFVSPAFSTPILHWTIGSVLGDLATAVLPSAFRIHREFNLYYANRPISLGDGGLRRQQTQVANSLHQLWVFLLIFAILCLLLF